MTSFTVHTAVVALVAMVLMVNTVHAYNSRYSRYRSRYPSSSYSSYNRVSRPSAFNKGYGTTNGNPSSLSSSYSTPRSRYIHSFASGLSNSQTNPNPNPYSSSSLLQSLTNTNSYSPTSSSLLNSMVTPNPYSSSTLSPTSSLLQSITNPDSSDDIDDDDIRWFSKSYQPTGYRKYGGYGNFQSSLGLDTILQPIEGLLRDLASFTGYQQTQIPNIVRNLKHEFFVGANNRDPLLHSILRRYGFSFTGVPNDLGMGGQGTSLNEIMGSIGLGGGANGGVGSGDYTTGGSGLAAGIPGVQDPLAGVGAIGLN